MEEKSNKSGGSVLKRFKKSIAENARKVTSKSTRFHDKRQSKRELKSEFKQQVVAKNPFEKIFSKPKFDILNRISKGGKKQGRPGAVREKAQKLRQQTMGLEMKNRKRENVMVDKRFGEFDKSMSQEDKMLMRFMKEKNKSLGKTKGFSLEEEDELTHMGQSLSASGFTDVGLEKVEYESDEDNGMIDASVVKNLHFGGFEVDEKDPNARKSRNEIMKEIIAKSKKHKRERQMQKEEDLDLVEQVDAELDDIRGMLAPMSEEKPLPVSEGKMLVSSDRLRLIHGQDAPEEVEAQINRQEQEKIERKKQNDQDYDRFFRELAFEKRAQATDRTKTDEEIALEARQELEKQEQARIRRMKGLAESDDEEEERSSKKAKKDRKPMRQVAEADDLGDDEYRAGVDGRINSADIMPLTYNKDGVLVNDSIFMKPKAESSDDDDSSDESGDSDEESSDESSDGNEDSEQEESSDESGSETENVNDTADMDMEPLFEEISDSVKSDDEEGIEGASSQEDVDGDESEGEYVEALGDDDQEALEAMYNEENQIKTSSKKRKLTPSMKIAASELPYVFEAPNNYEEFFELIDNRSNEQQITIIKRLQVLYNPKLSRDNVAKMEKLTCLIADRIINVSTESVPDMALINEYRNILVSLARDHPAAFGKWCKKHIVQLRDSLNKGLATASKKSLFPSPGYLLVFMDLARIYSCSDMTHGVITPVMLLISQYLEQAPIYSAFDAMAGMLLCHTLYTYIVDSKRFIPEAVNYLHFVLLKCVQKLTSEHSLIPTLKKCTIELGITDFSVKPKNITLSEIFNQQNALKVNDQLRILMVEESIVLLLKLCKTLADSCSIIEIFEPIMDIIKSIPANVSKELLEIIGQASRVISPLIESAKLKRRPLELQKRKAVPIKTFVPKFHTSYSIDKRYDPDRARAEEGKLKAEYKKEFKGAVRELRRDAAFMVREKLAKIKKDDQEYNKKMNRIVGDLAAQEGSLRGMEKEQKKSSKKRR